MLQFRVLSTALNEIQRALALACAEELQRNDVQRKSSLQGNRYLVAQQENIQRGAFNGKRCQRIDNGVVTNMT